MATAPPVVSPEAMSPSRTSGPGDDAPSCVSVLTTTCLAPLSHLAKFAWSVSRGPETARRPLSPTGGAKPRKWALSPPVSQTP